MARKINMRAKMLREANSVYPDGCIENYFDLRTGEELDDPSGGDTMALFIGREISECIGDDMSLKEARQECARLMRTAADDLGDVLAHFEGAA